MLTFLDEVTGKSEVNFNKDFDSVNHFVIMLMVSMLGIFAELNRWVKDLLSDRRLISRVSKENSVQRSIISEHSEGPVLEPRFFCT